MHERFPAPARNLTTTTVYHDSGTIASVKAPNNVVTMRGYNGVGELTSTKDPAVETTSVVRDFAGRFTRATDPLGLKVDTACDPAGRAIGTTWRDGAGQAPRSTSAGYDAAGHQTRRTDGEGYVTTTTFNSWNLPESVIEPVTTMHSAASSRTWTTSYDALGGPVRLAQPGSVVRVRTYDALGNLTKETGTGTAASTQDRVLGYEFGWTDPSTGRVNRAARWYTPVPAPYAISSSACRRRRSTISTCQARSLLAGSATFCARVAAWVTGRSDRHHLGRSGSSRVAVGLPQLHLKLLPVLRVLTGVVRRWVSGVR